MTRSTEPASVGTTAWPPPESPVPTTGPVWRCAGTDDGSVEARPAASSALTRGRTAASQPGSRRWDDQAVTNVVAAWAAGPGRGGESDGGAGATAGGGGVAGGAAGVVVGAAAGLGVVVAATG